MPTPASAAYGASAGLDLIGGVFGFLNSGFEQSIANSQADMIRMEAEANAQRYEEQAAQGMAQEKVMYLASGVKLAGSPVDALATSARVAHENVESILMGGEAAALNERIKGTEAGMAGLSALGQGISGFAINGIKSYAAGGGGSSGNPGGN